MQTEVLEGFRLSQKQRHLWLEGKGNWPYVSQLALLMEGGLDEDRLKAAVEQLVTRHEILRTTFHSRPGVRFPIQVVDSAASPEWRRTDSASAVRREVRSASDQRFLHEILEQEARRFVESAEGSLIRPLLVELGSEDHVLILSLPSLCADAYSLAGMARELTAAYDRRQPPAELEEPVQFLQFSEWQFEMLADEEESAQGRGHWAKWGSDLAGIPALPFEVPSAQDGAFVPGVSGCRLEAGVSELLRAAASGADAVLDSWLLTAWAVLLWRLGSRVTLGLGCVADGRPYEELSEVLGPLATALPLRFELDGRQPFSSAVRAVHAARREGEEWQHCFEPRERTARDSDIFDLVFASESWPPPVAAGGLTWTFLTRRCYCERFALRLTVIEQGTDLELELAYDSERFGQEDPDLLLAYLERLAVDAARRPSVPIADLVMVDETEARSVLVDGNATARKYDGPASVYDLFARHAERIPAQRALVFEDRRFTFGELHSEAGRLAGRLRQLGVRRESVVGILLERSAEMIVGLLGVLRAGAAYTALDLNQPRERLARMLETSGASVVLTRERFRPLLPAGVEVLCVEDFSAWEEDVVGSGVEDGAGASCENLAYVVFTSGSTGRPKGVAVEHRQLANYVHAILEKLGLGADAQLAVVSSFAADLGNTTIFAALCGGGCLHVLSEERVLDGEGMAQYLDAHAIDVLKIVPSHLEALLSPEDPARSLPRQWLVLGGEAARPAWVHRLLEAGKCSVLNHYGPAEATVGVMCWKVTDELGDAAARLPLGRPLANLRAYVLEPRLVPAPAWCAAELYVAGAGLARGYLGQPATTADRFLPEPFSGIPGERMYRTGDLVRRFPEGRIVFLGRGDNQVKVRGFRVELGEVETVLLGHPKVRQAVVVVEKRSGRDPRLVAHVVTRRPAPPSEELVDYLQSRLPEYMMPAVVTVPELPLLPNGKVDRRSLAEYAEAERARPAFVPPRSEAERKIAEIWQEVLEVDQVGSDDNFFDLGGHSLLLVRVHARLRQEGFELSVIDLFHYPTVKDLAGLVGRGAEPRPVPAAAARVFEASAVTPGAVAVVGMAARFPGARDVDEFWRNLCGGVESVTFFTDEELLADGLDPASLRNPNYVKAQGVLEDAALFDAAFFGYSPREAELMDPQHRLFLECAWHGLEDAGYDPSRFPGRIGVFGGAGMSLYLVNVFSRPEVLANVDPMQIRVGNRPDFLPTRVSYKLNLRGPSVNVQTACSTSLVAVHLACQSLLRGEAEMALAGGVRAWARRIGYLYQEGGIRSPDGHCRPFAADSRGTLIGEGVGVVVLKRLEDALADGDSIRAVIRGTAINNDGSHKVGFTAPGIDGQTAVVRAALRAAGVDPASIDYVEAHGTATRLGDPVEFRALAEAFGPDVERRRCGLGSVKSNFGHLDAAAGVAGLIKTVLSLENGMLVPSLHYKAPNPEIDFAESPFYVNAELREWPAADRPRRAGVSSLGLGGTNAHAVVEQAPPVPESEPSRPWQLLVLAARTPGALDEMTTNLAAHLERMPEGDFADLAYTLQVGRRALPQRRIVVSRDPEEAIETLTSPGHRRRVSGMPQAGELQVAFLLPGHGSQYLGMGWELYESEPTYRAHVDQCLELLGGELGDELGRMLRPGEEEPPPEMVRRFLTLPGHFQPAIFIVEYALAQLLIEWGIRPAALVGHSTGEYVAAALAGVFTRAEGLRLIAARGRLMEQMPEGAMLSVALTEERIAGYLEGDLWLAAINGPELCAVSGTVDAVAGLVSRLEADGIQHRALEALHPYHSPMSAPILDSFLSLVREVDLKPPTVPCLSNLTGTWIRPQEAVDPHYWVRHMSEAVRFADNTRELLSRPEQVLLEVGPGQALSKLAARDPSRDERQLILATSPHPKDPEPPLAALLTTLGRLWTAGVEIDWNGFYTHERRRRVPAPRYPFQGRRYWISPPPTRRSAGPGEGFFTPSWQRTAPAHRPSPGDDVFEGPWLLFSGAHGLGTALARRLQRSGAETIQVKPGTAFRRLSDGDYEIDSESPEDYRALFDDLKERGAAPRVAGHLWSLEAALEDAAEPGVEHSFSELLKRKTGLGFSSLLLLAEALRESAPETPLRLGVVTCGAQAVTGQEELDPAAATALGPCRSILGDLERVRCRVIDVLQHEASRDERLADQLLAELAGRENEASVALRAGHRWVELYEPVRLADGATAPLRERGAYVLVGPLRDTELELARQLARENGARLAWVAPPASPERDASIEADGTELIRIDAQLSDPRSLHGAMTAALERLGAVHGVIVAVPPSAAGSTAAEELAARLAPLAALEPSFSGDGLDFVVLSSPLAWLVGCGEATDGAVGAYLGTLAHARFAGGGPWTLALHWDRPETPEAHGLAELFRRALGSGVAQLVASGVDPRLLGESSSEELSGDETADTEEGRAAADDLAQRPYAAPRNPTQATLAKIWGELLGIRKVGIFDNFFELGGDSVIMIQILAKANLAGITLSPSQIFQHQTIAELAATVQASARVETDVKPVSGEIPLAPLQRRFFEEEEPEPHRWNLTLLLETREPFDAVTVDKAVAHLLAHHDALRIRFHDDGAAWRQVIEEPDGNAYFAFVDLAAVPESLHRHAVESCCEQLQHSLHLTHGPLFRVVGFDRGPDRPGRLFLVGHHMVIDLVSWRILLDDLRVAYRQLERGEAVEMPAGTTPFGVWIKRLAEQAGTSALEPELDYWLDPRRSRVPSLPRDHRADTILIGSTRDLHRTLDVDSTQALLQEVVARRKVRIDAVLLAPLMRTLASWIGDGRLQVAIEGHGRWTAFPDVDLSRTVGWFTALYPLLLDVEGLQDSVEVLHAVDRQLAEVPERGVNYATLRYMSEHAEKLRELPYPEICFLYLGRLDHVLSEDSPFAMAPESPGSPRSPRRRHRYPLVFTAGVMGGELRLRWIYSESLFRKETVESLAEDYLEQVAALTGAVTRNAGR